MISRFWISVSITAFVVLSIWRLSIPKAASKNLWSITFVSESHLSQESIGLSTLEDGKGELFSSKANIMMTSESRILFVNAWVGSAMPSYFPLFLERIRLNPTISFLLISTRDTPEFCPIDGSPSRYFPITNPDIQVHCSDTEDLVKESARALCLEWHCSKSDLHGIISHFKDYISIDGQAWNNLKPLYATLFKSQIYSLFPHRSFSHWMRIDLDVFLGDFAGLFPQHLLDFDIFTFFPAKSMDWRYIYLKGYLTGHRLSSQIDKLWLTMSMYKDPGSFMQSFHSQTFNNVTRTLALDEGAQTVNTIRDHPEVSFIVEPDLLMVDLDIAADRDRKIVLYGNQVYILHMPVNGAARKRVGPVKHSEGINQARARSTSHIGFVDLSQNCDMPWLENRDRLCAASPRGSRVRQQLDGNSRIRISRESGSTEIRAYKLDTQAPGAGTPVMAYHAQVSKKDGLKYDRVPHGSRIEVSKGEDAYWRMRTIDAFERSTRLQRSKHYWPGVWE